MIEHVGQRVQLGYSPEHRGTVTHVWSEGSFRVTFDSHKRRRGTPRSRFVYPASAGRLFQPEGTEEIRVVDDSDEVQFPAALLREYGIG